MFCFFSQHFIYSIIINALVRNKCFYQIHQFIQYRVLADSKHIVSLALCLFFSLVQILSAHCTCLLRVLKLHSLNPAPTPNPLRHCLLCSACLFNSNPIQTRYATLGVDFEPAQRGIVFSRGFCDRLKTLRCFPLVSLRPCPDLGKHC